MKARSIFYPFQALLVGCIEAASLLQTNAHVRTYFEGTMALESNLTRDAIGIPKVLQEWLDTLPPCNDDILNLERFVFFSAHDGHQALFEHIAPYSHLMVPDQADPITKDELSISLPKKVVCPVSSLTWLF